MNSMSRDWFYTLGNQVFEMGNVNESALPAGAQNVFSWDRGQIYLTSNGLLTNNEVLGGLNSWDVPTWWAPRVLSAGDSPTLAQLAYTSGTAAQTASTINPQPLQPLLNPITAVNIPITPAGSTADTTTSTSSNSILPIILLGGAALLLFKK